MIIRKIVLTGGPCAGKTTALKYMRESFTELGWRVLTVPETATEFISGGVAPWTCGTNYDYQVLQMHMQREKERCYLRAAETMGSQADKVLIICDRGIFDNMVYIDKPSFAKILAGMETTREEVFASYDAVFHLVTAAVGSHGFGTANNKIRYEESDEAVQMDAKFVEAWSMHPAHYKIASSSDFVSKMGTLLNGVAKVLGEALPYPTLSLPEHLLPYEGNSDWENEVTFPEEGTMPNI